MRRLILLLPLLLVACPSGPTGPANGVDLTKPVGAWTLTADADWADAASAEVIRLGRLTAANVLDLQPQKAEGVCRILAHLDEPEARQLFIEMLEHPDSRSGFYRPFVLAGAVIAWIRAREAGLVESIAPLEERLAADAREITDYRWFGLLADSVEASESTATLPLLLEAAARLAPASQEAGGIVNARVLKAHRHLSDAGAVPLAKSILNGGVVFESTAALRYLDRHDPEAARAYALRFLAEGGPALASLHVLARGGGEFDARMKDLVAGLPMAKRRFLGWYGLPPAWEPPVDAQQEPAVARFLLSIGIGNRPKYLRLWIQPPLSKTTPRWFAEEQDALGQRAALQALFGAPLPSIFNARGEVDPYGVFPERMATWWESIGHRLTWDEARQRYTP